MITNSRTRSGARPLREQQRSARPQRNAAVVANANIKKRPLPLDLDGDLPAEQPQSADESAHVDQARASASSEPNSKRARTGRSTRSSRRNVADEEDEWQQIPDEWLKPEAASNSRRPARTTRANGSSTIDPATEGETDADHDAEAEAETDADAEAEGEVDMEAANGNTDPTAPVRSPSRPSSPPAQASRPAYRPVTSSVFGDDDSDLTDLSDVEEAGKDVPAKDQDEEEEDDEELEEEQSESDEDEDQQPVDEEYAIRIAAGQAKSWVEWENVSFEPLCDTYLCIDSKIPLTDLRHPRRLGGNCHTVRRLDEHERTLFAQNSCCSIGGGHR